MTTIVRASNPTQPSTVLTDYTTTTMMMMMMIIMMTMMMVMVTVMMIIGRLSSLYFSRKTHRISNTKINLWMFRNKIVFFLRTSRLPQINSADEISYKNAVHTATTAI
jgi:hypothetical protein